MITRDEAKGRIYLDRLQREVALVAPLFDRDREVIQLHLGGGTPNFLAPRLLGELVGSLGRQFSFSNALDRDFSIELDPRFVTPEDIEVLSAIGFNRTSLGVQDFDPEVQKAINREQGIDETLAIIDACRRFGMRSVNVDLIYGLPGRSASDWRRELETAVSLAPDHLSCYQLTIHQGTPFGFRLERGQFAELPEDAQAERFLTTHRLLADHGYEGYEVSNFARAPEHRSRHNAKYWDHTPYLGLGPSAHSYEGRRRWWNERKIKPWMAALEQGRRPVEEGEELSEGDLAFERLMLALRTKDGLDLAQYQRRYGVDLLAARGEAVGRLVGDGLIEVGGGRLWPTLDGLAVADYLARELGAAP